MKAAVLHFLGTGAGSPSRERNVSCGVLEIGDGRLWVIDCGEATQHQIMRSPLRASRIERILITHLHGDHVLGLPGLLASLAIHQRTEPVNIIGPTGIRELVDTVNRITDFQGDFPLTISELSDEQCDLGELDEIQVQAYAVEHRIASYAYSIRLPGKRGALDPHKAQALGVERGPKFKHLTDGFPVITDEGTTVEPDHVLGPEQPGFHLVWCGDCANRSAVHPWAQNCDLLVHEATYDHTRGENAATWGHSTGVDAIETAKAVHAHAFGPHPYLSPLQWHARRPTPSAAGSPS